MPLLHVIYSLLVVALWGANFVASKFALAHFPPIFVTALRFALLAAMLLPFVPRPNKAQAKHLIVLSMLGVLHFMLPQASLAAGLDIATCAVLNQLSVPFACLFGVFLLKEHIGFWRISGLILAFAGMLVVFGSPHLGGSWLGSAYAIGAALFFSLYNLLLKRHPDLGVMQILAYVCLFGTPQALLLSWVFETPSLALLIESPLLPLAAIVYTVIFSSIIGHGLWAFLVKAHPISKVAPFSLLVPITGVAFGQIFYREPLTWQLLLGGAMTLVGVAIIVLRRPKIIEIMMEYRRLSFFCKKMHYPPLRDAIKLW